MAEEYIYQHYLLQGHFQLADQRMAWLGKDPPGLVRWGMEHMVMSMDPLPNYPLNIQTLSEGDGT